MFFYIFQELRLITVVSISEKTWYLGFCELKNTLFWGFATDYRHKKYVNLNFSCIWIHFTNRNAAICSKGNRNLDDNTLYSLLNCLSRHGGQTIDLASYEAQHDPGSPNGPFCIFLGPLRWTWVVLSLVRGWIEKPRTMLSTTQVHLNGPNRIWKRTVKVNLGRAEPRTKLNR